MAKGSNIVFFCNECGYESRKWLGQCPSCKAWNTFVEEKVNTSSKSKIVSGISKSTVTTLKEVTNEDGERINTGFDELDRVLGGGIVVGSLTLVGGDPGIGKSTLLLQVCRNLANAGLRVLYISGEESLRQIKIRADRLGETNDNLKVLCDTDLSNIESVLKDEKPEFVIIDSIQTMYKEEVGSAPGSVGQVRESTNVLMQLAKGLNIPIVIVGHVTKEGVVAGPRVLEHMVDTVLYFEGDRHESYRVLRSVKNRFGATNEIGVFEMRNDGLREVLNPSAFMLEGRPVDAAGTVVACAMEGTRPLLVEVQALVCNTNFSMPKRTAAGMDYNRVNLLLAVLDKRAGLSISDCDAYVNIAGGMKLNEPGLDLAVAISLVSSFKNKPVASDTIVFGEIGLIGEVRSVTQDKARILEAKKLGFNRVILPEISYKTLCKDCKDINKEYGLTFIPIGNVSEITRSDIFA
ncbi:DNA repair protein RadA/Sms [Eubacterium uniforme]|uniref:DNA repair protein RadA n=1 Tax=Eubacterium uniforme TaxID=39495 RepID=A0A1T4VG81_9FIRM|nr:MULTISPECIES: DNA repair protein RadA [Eubacterium]MCR5629047.1 DNA repair protein RadA [Eubacterium sp.]SKA63969.1 DNA repair protein RadA/Sms [Eubacterium uniforme]